MSVSPARAREDFKDTSACASCQAPNLGSSRRGPCDPIARRKESGESMYIVGQINSEVRRQSAARHGVLPLLPQVPLPLPSALDLPCASCPHECGGFVRFVTLRFGSGGEGYRFLRRPQRLQGDLRLLSSQGKRQRSSQTFDRARSPPVCRRRPSFLRVGDVVEHHLVAIAQLLVTICSTAAGRGCRRFPPPDHGSVTVDQHRRGSLPVAPSF